MQGEPRGIGGGYVFSGAGREYAVSPPSSPSSCGQVYFLKGGTVYTSLLPRILLWMPLPTDVLQCVFVCVYVLSVCVWYVCV